MLENGGHGIRFRDKGWKTSLILKNWRAQISAVSRVKNIKDVSTEISYPSIYILLDDNLVLSIEFTM